MQGKPLAETTVGNITAIYDGREQVEAGFVSGLARFPMPYVFFDDANFGWYVLQTFNLTGILHENSV